MYLPQFGPNKEAPHLRAEDQCKVAEEVTHVLVGEASDGGSPSEASDSDISDMSEGTLETEFQKLLASDKLKFNQFYLYHYQVQKQEKTSGMLHQRVRHQIHSEIIPKLPEVIATEEMWYIEVEQDEVQIETVINPDGKEVHCILPILMKEEPDHQHTTHEPSKKPPGMPDLPPRATVSTLLHERDVKSYDEEATDSEDYLPNDENLPSEEDNSATESMEEEMVHVDIKAFDTALNEVTTGLEMAALGYHNLHALLPQLPIHEVPKVLESMPLIYTEPMPNVLINILKDISPEKVLDHAIAGEVKTKSSHHLRMKYSLQRAQTEKVLHGMASKGGSFYSKLFQLKPLCIPAHLSFWSFSGPPTTPKAKYPIKAMMTQPTFKKLYKC